jgi:hypothetical protein
MRFVTCLAILALAVVGAQASLIQLYSLDDLQYSGGGAGTTRGQHFSPTQATPNGLSGTGSESFFDAAALGIGVQDTDTLQGTLYLFTWNTDYSTSIGGTALGSTPVNLAGPGSGAQTTWLDVAPAAPLAASGQYLLHLEITGYSSPGTTGWYLERSSSDDGGPNNQAFNNGSAASSREYGVRVNAIPEPTTLSLLGLAVLPLLRRRR